MKRDTNVTISIGVDLSELQREPDSRLAMLWHLAQANPAPHDDKQAGEISAKVGYEIIRRWLKATPPEMYRHQERSYYWGHLSRFASHRDGDWRPDPEKLARFEQAHAPSGGES
ncbi:hypothetical protein [Streptomyces sp. NPDC001508]|uniref:hypothetical protein n=1 Tax=Streptomyces sp. NPDC001508 TaxID=3154656 RepID=UPI00332EA617